MVTSPRPTAARPPTAPASPAPRLQRTNTEKQIQKKTNPGRDLTFLEAEVEDGGHEAPVEGGLGQGQEGAH